MNIEISNFSIVIIMRIAVVIGVILVNRTDIIIRLFILINKIVVMVRIVCLLYLIRLGLGSVRMPWKPNELIREYSSCNNCRFTHCIPM